MPGNCLICAIWEWLKYPTTTSIKLMRNRRRRWHVYWVRDGKRFEFYAPGRSSKSYLGNLLYVGTRREF
jgi:hypothetical protein